MTDIVDYDVNPEEEKEIDLEEDQFQKEDSTFVEPVLKYYS